MSLQGRTQHGEDVLKIRSCSQEQDEEVIAGSHIDIVQYFAWKYHRVDNYVGHLDDLMSDGMLGLLAAIRRYDDEGGASFETYASIRIEGYIRDGIRQRSGYRRAEYGKTERITCDNEGEMDYWDKMPREDVVGLLPFLSLQEKQVVRLFYFGDLSRKEIGYVIDASPSLHCKRKT